MRQFRMKTVRCDKLAGNSCRVSYQMTFVLWVWWSWTVVLWPMCCHTGMPCRRHMTWHPTPSQYTYTGPTCRFAIHWCGTSHWNTQLPILMSWVRPDQEILPRPSTHQRTLNLMLSWWSTVGSSVESTVPTGSWTRDLWCANPLRYPLAHSDFLCVFVLEYQYDSKRNVVNGLFVDDPSHVGLMFRFDFFLNQLFYYHKSTNKFPPHVLQL